MRILLATYWVMPHVGGVKVYLDQMKSFLESQGHQVDIFANHPEFDRYHMINTGRVFYKSNIHPFIDFKIRAHYLKTFPELNDFCINYELQRYGFEMAAAYMGAADYDLIHTQDVISATAMQRIKRRRTPLVATIHGAISKEILISGGVDSLSSVQWHYLSTLEYTGAMAGDVTTVPSQWLKGVLANEFAVPYDKVRVIPNGIHAAEFAARMDAAPQYERSDWNRKVLICPARLNTIKGQQILIEALGQLKSFREDWVCWLVGDGENRGLLEAMVDALGLRNHVVFFGDRQDVPQLLKQADVFVMPSLQDNLPYAVMESMVAGLPAVAANAGGIPEMVISGESGMLSPVGDVSALAWNLRRILEDDELRRRMGEAAKRHAAYWSVDRMVHETVAAYHDAMRIAAGRLT
jgi:glycosyltransferase involved in cell wall biosynthesis